MDWSKAKTILIVALIVTNIFLAYYLLVEDNSIDGIENSETLQETQELLSRNGIVLETETPSGTDQLYNLVVEYETMDPPVLNQKFFNSKGDMNKTDGAIIEIQLEDEEIAIINNKLLLYEKNNPAEKNILVGLDQAIEIAKEFLLERGYVIDDMKLSYWKEIENGFYLDFTKCFEDSFIELSYTVFQIENGEVAKMERTWLNTKDVEETDYKIVPASKAILELLSMEDAKNKTIIDISICYYFDPEQQEYLDSYQQAKEGRAVPAWRVQFEDGYNVILDLE